MPAQLLSQSPLCTPPASVTRFHRALRFQARNQKLEAAREYLGALELHPGFFEAAFNLGVLFQEMGRSDEAVGCYRHALQCKPDLAPAWGNLGVALRDTGRVQDAVSSFRRALRLQPGEPDVLNNLGNALLAQHQYSEAIACFRDSLLRAPANPGINLNLGNALRCSGRMGEAIQSLRRALELQPDLAEAHWDLAFALLLQGDLAQGFQEYEWRWRRPDFPLRRFASALWLGEDLAGRTLLVHTEQGAGDNIQFARFIGQLPQRGARVLLECPPSLAALFESVDGVSRVIPKGDPLPEVDFHLPLLSLPQRLGVTLETIPTRTPYLQPPANRCVVLPPPHCPQDVRLKIGLAWRGNPQHPNDHQRSLPLALLEPLFAVPNVAFYDLQLAPGPQFAGEGAKQPALVPLEGLLRDFADTASVVSQLDLVIAADTSVAHLAGAQGRTAWILLPFAPDWRWMLAREDTPWYPTLRLFRQPTPGDWATVVRRVRDALLVLARAPFP
jgi:Tfp pilus assembly protein PilF